MILKNPFRQDAQFHFVPFINIYYRSQDNDVPALQQSMGALGCAHQYHLNPLRQDKRKIMKDKKSWIYS